MHPIQEAFGEDCDLYKDVLRCSSDTDQAGLRKAYYRRALQFHPDKQQSGKDGSMEPGEAQRMFQAISLAYQILKDPENRAVYDETNEIPSAVDDDMEGSPSEQGAAQWKKYFDRIFGKVTASDIDAFSAKYKCSDEERRDVFREFVRCKGNLMKMIDFVMLSEQRDAARWVEDYIRPAMEGNITNSKEAEGLKDLPDSVRNTMESSLKKILAKISEGEEDKMEADADETDTEETDSEDELPAVLRSPSRAANKKKTTAVKKDPSKIAVKVKATKAKKRTSKKDNTSLVAQIQKKGGLSIISDIGKRYGVEEDADDDPLDDATFARIQASMKKK